MNPKSIPPVDIDEMFRRLAHAYAELEFDPKRIGQVQTLANVAGKAAKFAEIKFLVSMARNQEPDDPMFGAFSGVPLKSSKVKLSPKEVAYQDFKKQLPEKTEG